MLSRKKRLEQLPKEPGKPVTRTSAEARFLQKIRNPPAPTEKLIEIFREYGKYAK
ncbi:MAG: hypothetical protein LCH95_17075 [Proteobacteria bacterium]|nr:hypothetical protein [Pseudomonadota bacterium]